MIYITPKYGKTWQGKHVSLLPHPLTRGFFNAARQARKPIDKVAHKIPKVPPSVCIISICLIQIPLLILRYLTQSFVHLHPMKTQFSKPLTSVGVYASIYPKNTDTLRYGTASASWVNTIMDSKPTVLFYWQKIQPESS